MRILGAALILAVAACSGAPRGPLHPAVEAGAGMTDEQELSFFQSFDDDSFRALAERAFRDRIPKAEHLLSAVLWNWYPGFPEQAQRRRRAQQLLVPLTGHADARVREGAWWQGRYLYDKPETSAAWSAALPSALRDPDPDVRLAAIKTSIDFQAGWTGGCIADVKKTSYSIWPHGTQLSARLFEEPDVRVRRELLRALSWCGRRLYLPAFTRYFTEADRRGELTEVSWSVWMLFENPEEGRERMNPWIPQDPEATMARLMAFAESLRGTPAARRNGIVLVLHMASEMNQSVQEDRRFLGRVVEWLEREEEYTREEDLDLILRHWRVMDPAKLNHRLHDFVRHSDVPEVLKGLKETLAALP